MDVSLTVPCLPRGDIFQRTGVAMKVAKGSKAYQAALDVVRTLRGSGHEAYLAGGCVRDMFREIEPEDYDVASSARPEEVVRLFPKVVEVGARFGVVQVMDQGIPIQVATFRTDGPYEDGRHPSEVSFASLREDVLRRDFTINGMMYDPLQERVVDLVGGQQDLRDGWIRAIGDPRERFQEDHLRMLRAIRFACQLGFRLEAATREAIAQAASQIRRTSGERIREELKKILLSARRREGVRLMHETGLLRQILPEVSACVGVEQPPEFHPEGDVFTHTLLALEKLEKPSWELCLGLLLHDIGKPPTFQKPELDATGKPKDRIRFPEHDRVGAQMAEAICDRLRLSREEKERVVFVVDRHMVFKDVRQMRESTRKRLLAHPYFPILAELHRADCLASHGKLGEYEFCQAELAELGQAELRPKPLVRGGDLIEMGLSPGPIFSKLLRAVEDAQLEGTVHTKEEAKRLVEQLIRPELPKFLLFALCFLLLG